VLLFVKTISIQETLIDCYGMAMEKALAAERIYAE